MEEWRASQNETENWEITIKLAVIKTSGWVRTSSQDLAKSRQADDLLRPEVPPLNYLRTPCPWR